MSELLRVERAGPDGMVARVTLARPEARNAFNAALIDALQAAFAALAGEGPHQLRAVVLAGDGSTFSAGADIAWQRDAAGLSLEENEADAGRLQAMLETVDACPVPVVARVQGAALGGGMGLCAVADIVIAVDGTTFGFTEVKLGILPAIISPFVLARIGEGHARALFVTGERFGADRAQHIGLVHEVVADEAALDARTEDVVADVLASGPTAVREAKALIRARRGLAGPAFAARARAVAARQRVSDEGQEGLGAFLDRRRPTWAGDDRS
jgi:methylglutaconyl-CoA hydratase